MNMSKKQKKMVVFLLVVCGIAGICYLCGLAILNSSSVKGIKEIKIALLVPDDEQIAYIPLNFKLNVVLKSNDGIKLAKAFYNEVRKKMMIN